MNPISAFQHFLQGSTRIANFLSRQSLLRFRAKTAINTFQTQFNLGGMQDIPMHTITYTVPKLHMPASHMMPTTLPIPSQSSLTMYMSQKPQPKLEYIPSCGTKNSLQIHNWPQNLVAYCIVQGLHRWFIVHVKYNRDSFLQAFGDGH